MTNIANRERLAQTFTTLCEISSPSRKEKAVADYLKSTFTALGADAIIEDDSMAGTGSDSGNLIIRFNGNDRQAEGIFFSCHMDTVEPGEGVEVVRTGDIFTSRGETILGSDDKSGLAAIIELITLLKENSKQHGLVELVITTCEEIGLLGAKHLDFAQVQAGYGYALDSSGIDTVIIGAPAANKFSVEITGAAAHAGLHPEMGLSAIQVASRAISTMTLGRLDHESTANIGVIHGGVATNIIPEIVTIDGEVRSHSKEKLARYTEEIEADFRRAVAEWQNSNPDNDIRPKLAIDVAPEYPALSLAEDSPVIQRVRKAGGGIGKELDFITAGGGSDANILNSYGLPTAIIATGMSKVHTTDEQLDLGDLVSLTELIYAITVDEN